MTGRISSRTCYTKLNFDFPYVRFPSLRRDTYVVFKPKRHKLFCPPVYLHSEKLSRIHETKYLGCFLSDDQSGDVEISKQIPTLYTRTNKLFRMFS